LPKRGVMVHHSTPSQAARQAACWDIYLDETETLRRLITAGGQTSTQVSAVSRGEVVEPHHALGKAQLSLHRLEPMKPARR
jgi:hypothetical protein